MAAAEQELQVAMDAIAGCFNTIKTYLYEIKSSAKGLFSEARSALVKLELGLARYSAGVSKLSLLVASGVPEVCQGHSRHQRL